MGGGVLCPCIFHIPTCTAAITETTVGLVSEEAFHPQLLCPLPSLAQSVC